MFFAHYVPVFDVVDADDTWLPSAAVLASMLLVEFMNVLADGLIDNDEVVVKADAVDEDEDDVSDTEVVLAR